jgi:hypothetical protein
MDRFQYRDILQANLLPFAEEHHPDGYFLLQDNDPKHNSGVVREFCRQNGIRVLNFPAQSPDLNPIEHLWGELKRRVWRRSFRTQDALFVALQEEWLKIPVQRLQNLVDSMPARLQAVKATRGYHTKY